VVADTPRTESVVVSVVYFADHGSPGPPAACHDPGWTGHCQAPTSKSNIGATRAVRGHGMAQLLHCDCCTRNLSPMLRQSAVPSFTEVDIVDV